MIPAILGICVLRDLEVISGPFTRNPLRLRHLLRLGRGGLNPVRVPSNSVYRVYYYLNPSRSITHPFLDYYLGL